MTTYHYESIAVYSELGGALRLARSVRAFVTDPTTGAPVNATQGARVAPYVDADATGDVSFTAESWPVRLTNGTVYEDVWPIDAAGPIDATVAGLVGAATATQTALDARYVSGAVTLPIAKGGTGATTAATARTALGLGSVDNTADLDKPVSDATAAAITALQDASASIEDLSETVTFVPVGMTVSAAWNVPLLIAPFPLTVTSLSIVSWSTAVAASNTSYYTFTAQIMSTAPAPRTIASKTTKVTGGEAFTVRKAWDYSGATWADSDAAAGEIVHLSFAPTGSPAAIAGPMLATVGYRPL